MLTTEGQSATGVYERRSHRILDVLYKFLEECLIFKWLNKIMGKHKLYSIANTPPPKKKFVRVHLTLLLTAEIHYKINMQPAQTPFQMKKHVFWVTGNTVWCPNLHHARPPEYG